MPQVIEYLESEMDYQTALACASLRCNVFSDRDRTPQALAQNLISPAGREASNRLSTRRYVIWNDDQSRALAHAITFNRSINTEAGPIEILALAAVCTDPEFRGLGLGAAVVQAAFTRVDNRELDVSLFQTGVAEFYEKLNCRVVDNQIVNSQDKENPQANPFWDKSVMIYPASRNWPSGTIDLNGPGY